MLSDYFVDITVTKRTQGDPDGLGGLANSYETLGTVKGLLQRASTQERIIAAQNGVKDVYTFMTKPNNNDFAIEKGYILSSGTITAILTSSPLHGQSQSDTMKEISQWTAESHIMEG